MDEAWVGEQHDNLVDQLQTARNTAAIDHDGWCCTYSSSLICLARFDTPGDSAGPMLK